MTFSSSVCDVLRSDICSALEPLTFLSVRQVLVRRKLAHPLLLLAAAIRPSLMSVTATLRDFRSSVLELQGATAQLQKKSHTTQLRSVLTNHNNLERRPYKCSGKEHNYLKEKEKTKLFCPAFSLENGVRCYIICNVSTCISSDSNSDYRPTDQIGTF